jgi:uncharacterized membrane protein YbhN (UPF0104 family)
MRNLVTFALKAAISSALLYFAFAHVNFDLVGRQLSQLRYIWLAAAVLISIAQIGLVALRWQTIAKPATNRMHRRSHFQSRSATCSSRGSLIRRCRRA